MRVALLGTRGVPANYGGFETCAEEVSVGLTQRGHDITVYCRRANVPGDPAEYKGVRLRYTPHIEHKSLGTLTHSLTSTWDAMRRDFDVLLYFNSATAPAALIAKVGSDAPIVLNVDGLEWKRRKWGVLGRTYYVLAEWLSGKVADRVIADSLAIQRYYAQRWKRPSTFVPYGAHLEGPERPEVLQEYGLAPDSYFLVASRLEPENNADITIEAFRRLVTDKRLVIAGGANYRSRFVERLRRDANDRVLFLGPVYKAGHIRELHCGAFAYVHGNEVGGTNPALLKALGYGNCVLALNGSFNAEVVGDAALLYGRDPDDLARQMRRLLAEPQLVHWLRERARQRIREAYQWDHVVDGYERLLERAAALEYRASRDADDVYPAAEAVARTAPRP